MAGPVVLVGNILTLRAWCTQGNQASVNTFHYRVDASSGLGCTTGEIADEFSTLIGTTMKGLLNNVAFYNGVQCYVNQLPLPLPQDSTLSSGQGTGGATSLPPQSCGLTEWDTNFAGPANRGRTYWPFPSTAEDSTGGVPGASYISVLATFGGLLITHTLFGTLGNTCNVTFVLKHGKNKAGTIPAPSPIVNSTAIAKWATQKRRSAFGRPNVSPV
jgi:hypothetical protein